MLKFLQAVHNRAGIQSQARILILTPPAISMKSPVTDPTAGNCGKLGK